MTAQLNQAIQMARTLSLSEQLELMKALSVIIQQTHSLTTQSPDDEETSFSPDSFQRSWQQAMTGETPPLSQLWEGIENDLFPDEDTPEDIAEIMEARADYAAGDYTTFDDYIQQRES